MGLTGTLEIELLGARAELLLRQQELAELQHGSRPAELDRARAHAAAAEAREIYATAKLKRTQRLYEQRAGINQDELDQAQAAATAISQEFKVATADLELMEEGVPLNIIQQHLGHSNIATTSIYLQRLRPEQVLGAISVRQW